ncbi:afadin-like [Gouania willdenowi]|uniref:afadin-like n=1 Tax=Gouania willdenowi TaxID=441366 RepID=UPI0010557FD4|nr:afadin-like [Gouania willdenowi]
MPEDDRDKIAKVIRQWNNTRMDLFEISQPDENLQFHGVMRFYFEDHVEGNVATKCLRVCSNSPASEVIETLCEKFRPDMKMLTHRYSLYEIHSNKEHKLDLDERPLIVQLNWRLDNREGHFVLKKDKDSVENNAHEKDKGGVVQKFKRTLSKKGKKKEKTIAEDERGLTESPLNSSRICLSEPEKQKEQSPSQEDHPGLPVGIDFCDTSEDSFLSAVINYTNSSTVYFKLSPAYILYATGIFALQRHDRRPSPPSGIAHDVTSVSNKMAAMMGKVIQRQREIAGALAFWMANTSELLNFLKHDKDLDPLTQQSQLDLGHLVHKAYSFLQQCLQEELRTHLPTFLIDPEKHGALPPGIEMVLNTLMNTMALMRRSQVNPALTIQLFSQLFHFISTWLFNQLMSSNSSASGLRSHYWGAALRQRLSAIEGWAERQGMELAADCHLGHIIQATTLLTMNKYSMQDVKDIQSTCFKLNSLQLHKLLSSYLCATNEPHIPADLIDAVVTTTQVSSDNLIQNEGRDIQLEESLDLPLPFLLPEGGYSCDSVRGIPAGFTEFLAPVCQKGLCSLITQSNTKGDWTVNFKDPFLPETAHREPGITTITLNKPLNSGMGVSIVAAKGAGQGNLGIYIKSIVKGGPAEINGRLTAGDQLLSVDGRSLVGLSQERAAAIMMQTGPVVTLQVAKFGASYHGLGALLSEATPQKTVAGDSGHAKPSAKAVVLSGNPQPLEHLHGSSREAKKQKMQRNRQLYRSNPDMSDLCMEAENEPVDSSGRGNITCVSTINLCTNTVHRDYLTLPTAKLQDKRTSLGNQPPPIYKTPLRSLDGHNSSRRSFLRQALSQENLCTDGGGSPRENMWMQRNQAAKQSINYHSSFPIRTGLSTHDILYDCSPSTKQQQGSRTSSAGVWRAPFYQHPTPTPSVQPIRIDIPVTRAVNPQPNPPPFITFKQNSSKQSPQNLTSHIYASPISVVNEQKNQPARPQVSITPTKHVSFQEPLSEQRKCSAGRVKQNNSSVMADPWKKEAKEKLEEQQRLRMVDLLKQEVQQLETKDQRTAVESDRLRRMKLEWQFQKRLQEVQQREEDDEEDLDMMLTLEQLGPQVQVVKNSMRDNKEKKNEEERLGSRLSVRNEEATDQKSRRLSDNVPDMASKEKQAENMKRALAPEKLPFKERQRLFSSSAESKVQMLA